MIPLQSLSIQNCSKSKIVIQNCYTKYHFIVLKVHHFSAATSELRDFSKSLADPFFSSNFGAFKHNQKSKHYSSPSNSIPLQVHTLH